MANNDGKNKTRGQIVLAEILKDTGLTATAFAEKIGISVDTVQNISCGRVLRLSNRVIDAIVTIFPRYDKFWLLSGEGDKFIPGFEGVVNTTYHGKNIATGTGASAGDMTSDASTDIINRLLDELAAQRQQNQAFLEIIKKMMK